ncbi:MAG: muconolactone Delta-isomerase family protein [Thaumarchaeota archaeon]|nr:muconolactone Delta-isomerase family protein [Nitrososphaerota archaeon]
MQYLIRGVYVEENTAGKPLLEAIQWIEKVVHPSLEMMEKSVHEKKITGGVVAGVREGIMIMDASSHEEVGAFLRSLPFWGALKWSVTPLQSFKSAVDQDKVAFEQARKMM